MDPANTPGHGKACDPIIERQLPKYIWHTEVYCGARYRPILGSDMHHLNLEVERRVCKYRFN